MVVCEPVCICIPSNFLPGSCFKNITYIREIWLVFSPRFAAGPIPCSLGNPSQLNKLNICDNNLNDECMCMYFVRHDVGVLVVPFLTNYLCVG